MYGFFIYRPNIITYDLISQEFILKFSENLSVRTRKRRRRRRNKSSKSS